MDTLRLLPCLHAAAEGCLAPLCSHTYHPCALAREMAIVAAAARLPVQRTAAALRSCALLVRHRHRTVDYRRGPTCRRLLSTLSTSQAVSRGTGLLQLCQADASFLQGVGVLAVLVRRRRRRLRHRCCQWLPIA